MSDTGEKLLEKFRDGLDLGPAVEAKIMSMVEKYRALDEDGKAEFTETLKETFKNTLSKHSSSFAALKFWTFTKSYAVLLVAVILLLLVFVFFGYKLYKSLVERERKREEKRKLKQLKKKK